MSCNLIQGVASRLPNANAILRLSHEVGDEIDDKVPRGKIEYKVSITVFKHLISATRLTLVGKQYELHPNDLRKATRQINVPEAMEGNSTDCIFPPYTRLTIPREVL